MNHHNLILSSGAQGASPHAAFDTLEARFGLRVAASLTQRSMELGADVNERLRFARDKALEHARAHRIAGSAPKLGVTSGGTALLGSAGSGWWLKIASVLPMVALIAGLVLIQRWQDNTQISVAAEVDAALLADDLPPKAYSDAGFAEFLKTPSPTE